jgi:hypothetical protein
MRPDHRVGLREVAVLLVLFFILCGHKLPSFMRASSRHALAATQHLPPADRKLAIFAYLALIWLLAAALLLILVAALLQVFSVTGRS